MAESARISREHRDLDEAEKWCREALSLVPDSPEALNAMGAVLKDRKDFAGAKAAWTRAIQVCPTMADPHNNLGTILVAEGKFDQAIDAYQRAIQAIPTHAAAHINLSLILIDQGRIEEARRDLEYGLSSMPESTELASGLLFLLECDPSIEPGALFEKHLDWARKYGKSSDHPPMHTNVPDPNRRLRLGYVSGDFKNHVVVRFATALFTRFSPQLFEIFCFSNTPTPDEVTADVKNGVNHWHDITSLSDTEASQLIRREQIDILVDLSGHTRDNRLALFALKPAPVQVTYLGYPDTTGLKAIDYRLTDRFADPPGMTERFHSEELVRLPSSFLCFEAMHTPAISWSPRERIVFGCFNAFRKVNDQVIATWSAILHRVRGSKLMLKSDALRSENCQRRIIDRFASHGIPTDRLILKSWVPSYTDHLDLHNEIDIILDPFPYNGTTTTCDALWMGVPVIALAGQTHRARVSVSLLSNVGVPELIAPTIQDYVNITVDLANDSARLAGLRAELRDRMIRSPLMKPAAFITDIETAYRKMWERWCHHTN
jgi:protein O-GlcNAc transferase